jgi:ribosomal protein S18 acetylase RimI-like enzyme
MNNGTIQITEYKINHHHYFDQLNRNWFKKHFGINPEPIDEFVLMQPEKAILEHGGKIWIGLWANQLAGTVAIKKVDDQTYELTKMAVQEEFRSKGIGLALLKAAIRKARGMEASRLILYSHSSLQAAIHLYRKLGFREIQLEPGTYSHLRCNIKMELLLDNVSVVLANPDHASDIAAIGKESFRDSFRRFFLNQDELSEYVDFTYDIEKIRQSLGWPNNIFFVTLYNSVPIGFAKMKKLSNRLNLPGSRPTELQKIYLLKKYQGLGAGDLLINTIFQKVQEWNADYLWLDVLEGNDQAICLYQKKGFCKRGEHFFKIGTQTFKYDVMIRSMII